jgi:PAS domain S-box-containing protein
MMNNIKIMIIDDNPDSLVSISDLLKNAGYGVIEAATVLDGLESACNDVPNVVILEATPGDSDRVELCRRINTDPDFADSRVILVSEKDLSQEEYDAWAEVGADEIILKPISSQALLARLKTTLRLQAAEAALNKRGASDKEELEEALRISRAKFRGVFNSNAIGMIFTDMNGVIEEANDTFLRIVGYDREDLDAGRLNWEAMTPDEYAEQDARAVNELKTSGVCSPFEKEYFRKDGTRVPVLLAASVLEGEQTRGFSVLIDRSEYKEADAARRLSEKRFRSLVTASPGGIYLTNKNGDCEYVNQSWCKMAGMSMQDAMGANWANGLHPEDRESVFENWKKMVESGGVWNHDYRFQNQDGASTWVSGTVAPILDDSGDVTGYIGVNLDVTDRIKAQESLKEIEERFTLAMDASRDGLYDWDLKTNAIYYSPGWKRILGYEDHEILNDFSVWERLTDPEDARKSWIMLEELTSRKRDRFELEFKMLHKDGHWVHILSRARAVFNSEGEAVRVVGTHVDITEINRARTEMETLARSLEEAQVVAELGSWEYDAVTGAVSWSKEMFRICCIDPESGEPDKNAHGLITHPEDKESVEAAFQLALEGGRVFNVEYRILQRDGDYRWVRSLARTIRDESGQVIRVLGTTQDIHERKSIEEELRNREEHFRSLFEGVPISLWEEDYSGVLAYLNSLRFREIENFEEYLLDHPEVTAECAARVRIIAVNEASLALHKAKTFEELMVGLPATFTEQSYQVFRDQLVAIWRGDDRWSGEAELKTLDGEPRQVVAHWSVPHGYLETMSRVYVSITDVTEKASLEHQLRQSQKMESIGRLAGGVAHDFNNLLTVIQGYSSMIHEELDPGNPMLEHIEEITHAGERAADLTQQLLAFSRKQIVAPQVIDLNDMMRKLDKMLQRLIGEDVRLVFNLDEDLEKIDMDPGQMNQVLVNLAVNARDAMPDGGTMTFTTSNATLNKHDVSALTHSTATPHVMISVGDSGHGMDAKTQEKIFEPFFTTKSMDQGTGLGLATVYGIIKQGNGMIKIDSAPGQGTTFKIYLPVSQRMQEVASPASETKTKRGKTTILLIEDEDAVRKTVSRILVTSGYTVLEAAHPLDALSLARQHGTDIDMVLTDVVMPEMSGSECHRELCKIVPDIKVLFMSGYTSDVITNRGVLDEGTHFIHKPFTKTELQQKLQMVLYAS